MSYSLLFFLPVRCAQLHFGTLETFAGTSSLTHSVIKHACTLCWTCNIQQKKNSNTTSFFLFSPLVSFTHPDSSFSSLLFFSLLFPLPSPHGWVWQGHGFKDVQAPECRSAIGAELPIRNSCAFVGHSLSLLKPAAIAEPHRAMLCCCMPPCSETPSLPSTFVTLKSWIMRLYEH